MAVNRKWSLSQPTVWPMGTEYGTMLVTAANLRPIYGIIKILKFADDTYLVVPAVNTMTCADERSHIESWATENNFKLNCRLQRQRKSSSNQIVNEGKQSSFRSRNKASSAWTKSLHWPLLSITNWQQPITSTTSWQHVPASSMFFVCCVIMVYLNRPWRMCSRPQCSSRSHTACLYGSDFVPQLIVIDSTPSCVVALS